MSAVPVVFINYRVQEQPGYATLLHRELTARLGADTVFLSSDSIRAGDDFVREVFDSLRQSEVVLTIIGSRWLVARGEAHGYGLGHGADWVHREIAEALARGIRVIPVVVEDAEMPDEQLLPADIAALARCQYVRLRHYSIEIDLTRLVDELRRTVPSLSARADSGFSASDTPLLFSAARGPASTCRIGVLAGTILRVRSADVWVNSENTDMEMARFNEFSISAIIRYWGAVRDGAGRVVRDLIADELRTRVGTNRPVAPGTVVTTESGELAASHNVRRVVHVASAYGEPGAGFRQVRDIGWCVTNALIHCEQLAASDPDIRTVLFPLLGTGMASASVGPTARTMAVAALDYIAQHPATSLRGIYLLASNEQEHKAVMRTLATLPLILFDP